MYVHHAAMRASCFCARSHNSLAIVLLKSRGGQVYHICVCLVFPDTPVARNAPIKGTVLQPGWYVTAANTSIVESDIAFETQVFHTIGSSSRAHHRDVLVDVRKCLAMNMVYNIPDDGELTR